MTMDTLKKIRENEIMVSIVDEIKKTYFKFGITDEKLINKRFLQRLGRKVELENPVMYNDKLQWMKLYWNDPIATKCADKYEVREIVNEKIGSKYLNELYNVYESVNEINIDELPDSFVLKGTHGSGYNIICRDKKELNWDEEFKKMRRWLRTNYYLSKREWVYKDIKPRIICEKFLADDNGIPPMDYKIFCFDGEPKLIQVDVDRFGAHRQNFYNTDWTFKDIEIEKPSDKNIKVERPKILEEMLELSKKLSKGFPHVRVDFYNIDDRPVFGELTFFHHSGMGKFNPPEFEIEMGEYLKLPSKSI